MKNAVVSKELRKRIEQANLSKRGRVVSDLILKNGHATTEDIANAGYEHSPRAARDVKDHGLPLKKRNVRSPITGKTIADYYFDEASDNEMPNLSGRSPVNKSIKRELIASHGLKCAICAALYRESELQMDHRVPFVVAGNTIMDSEFQLVCPSCNLRKKRACETCPLSSAAAKRERCNSCFWADPSGPYEHIAGREHRQLTLTFEDSLSIQAIDQLGLALVRDLLSDAARTTFRRRT